MGTGLQWGRDRLIAEFKESDANNWLLFFASMGPRSIDRGISIATWHARCAIALQWGRDRLIAELRPDNRRRPLHARLQWGRDRLVAELPRPSGDLAAPGSASMGPRSIDRGIGQRREPPATAPRASMGPRSIDRGID